MDRSHFIYSAVDCFLFLAVICNAVMNIHVQVFVSIYVFSSLRYIPRSGITVSHGDSIFNFLRNCQTVFQSGYTLLHYI